MKTGKRKRETATGRWWMFAAGVLLVAAAAMEAFAAEVAAGPGAIPATPPSLAALYPPAAERPVHLFAMLGMQEAFSGVVADLLEGDTEGARAAFGEFQEQYRSAAVLVPEWRGAYPEAPVRELGAALASADRGTVMKAIDAVGGVCHGCHLSTMAPVQLRYRWGSFAGRTVTDPIAGDTAPYGQFKLRLATALAGTTRNLRQGQTEGARRQFQAFRARFEALAASCGSCHATPRTAFVNPGVSQMIEEVGRALEAAEPDRKAVEGLAARIGRESCSGCHLVHVPAAMAQAAAGAGERR